LQTKEGIVSGNMAVIRQLVQLTPEVRELAGKTSDDRYEVEQWLSFVNTTLVPVSRYNESSLFENEVTKVSIFFFLTIVLWPMVS
jgi:glutathione S-transferase